MPPTSVVDHVSYWDRYAAGVSETSPEAALKEAFGWTQYEEHGPGDEILGDPATALELGSGRGNAVAALAIKGVGAVGLDVSPAQRTYARDRWGHLPLAQFEQGDVLTYLSSRSEQWDAIYSIFGALWFTDPYQLLPLVHQRLAPAGRLVFSQAPAVPGSYGAQGMYGAGFTGRRAWLYRWAFEPEGWADLLVDAGFSNVTAQVVPAPEEDHVGTLLVEASR